MDIGFESSTIEEKGIKYTANENTLIHTIKKKYNTLDGQWLAIGKI